MPTVWTSVHLGWVDDLLARKPKRRSLLRLHAQDIEILQVNVDYVDGLEVVRARMGDDCLQPGRVSVMKRGSGRSMGLW